MTQTIVAALMFTLGIAGLVAHHSYRLHREHARARARFAASYPARLATVKAEYPYRHGIDGPYRELLALAEAQAARPYDAARFLGDAMVLAEVGVDVVTLMEKPERAA